MCLLAASYTLCKKKDLIPIYVPTYTHLYIFVTEKTSNYKKLTVGKSVQ